MRRKRGSWEDPCDEWTEREGRLAVVKVVQVVPDAAVGMMVEVVVWIVVVRLQSQDGIASGKDGRKRRYEKGLTAEPEAT